jgi:hypothetical protein
MKWILPFIAIAALIGGGVYVSSVFNENQELKSDKVLLEAQIRTHEINLALFEEMLENERQIRDTAEVAIDELKQDVPDVDYETPLPESIQGVLDRFHSSSRMRNP